jgi:adenylate cyclase
MPPVRRLTAILAADVAGYSRLMGADEEGTHERLKAHLRELVDPKIAEHRGRVVKNTGDGFLAEFQSVVDAVRCAVEVQRGMAERNQETPPERRIEFRIGVNLGDVIAEEHDIFGDGVNVAARLEALAEPGGICVSRVVRDQVRDRLDFLFEDMGEQQVKNIARPVRVYQVRDRAVLIKQPLPTSPQQLPLPDKPSIAVLPFTNMSGDPEQGYFADGIAEDIITALSRYPSLFVIARNSSFAYRGRMVDVKQVGRELGVRYVLEGSIRRVDNRIRVTAQLVDAESSNHVLAERYDRQLADIFAVQGEITEAVTIAITPAIADAEQQRAMRKPPASLDAWAAYQRGLWHLSKVTAADNALAQKFFQQAVDLDPSFAGGYKGLSVVQSKEPDYEGRGLPETLRSAEALARRAVALDGADAEARSLLATTLRRRGDYEGGLAEAARALTLSPNLAGPLRNGRQFDLLGATEGRYCGYREKHQAGPSPGGSPFEPDRVGTVLLRGISGCRRSGKPRNSVIPQLPQRLSLARRGARPARPYRRGEARAGKSNRDRPSRIRHVCTRARPLATAGGPRPYDRGSPQGRDAGGVRPSCRGGRRRLKRTAE